MTTAVQKSADRLQADLDKIVDLVESAHYASAFENIDQYRTALNEFIKEVTKS